MTGSGNDAIVAETTNLYCVRVTFLFLQWHI